MKRPNDILEVLSDSQCTVVIDGKKVIADKNETVLSTLFAYGKKDISKNDREEITGAYCGMGICYLCTVTIDNVSKVRSCQTFVEKGMVIETQSNIHFRKDSGTNEAE